MPDGDEIADEHEIDPLMGPELDPEQVLEEQAEAARTARARGRNAASQGRTTPIAIRFDQFTLERLKALATLRNVGYQTLLKQFVVERLYEEEKRADIIDR
jgi:hypothetical protein